MADLPELRMLAALSACGVLRVEECRRKAREKAEREERKRREEARRKAEAEAEAKEQQRLAMEVTEGEAGGAALWRDG